MRRQVDNSIIEMALIGYAAERRKIEEAMATIQRQLGGRTKSAAAPAADGAAPAPRRTMSAASRKRIAAAQKKRWAVFHTGKPGKRAAATRKDAPKKAVSADVKQKRIAALAKARAAKAAKKAAQQSASS